MVEKSAELAQTAAENIGVVDTIKERLDVGSLIDRMKLSKPKIVEIGIYTGLGFIFGFLLKRYGTYLGVFVLMLIGLWALHQFEVVHMDVNWGKVYEFFGISSVQDVTADGLLRMIWEWVKINTLISIGIVVGFLIGLKVG